MELLASSTLSLVIAGMFVYHIASHISNAADEESYGQLNDYYTQAASGEAIDCQALVDTTILLPVTPHMKEHGQPPEEASVFDYMAATGNDFRHVDACAEEIFQAQEVMCDEVSALVTEVNLKNAELKVTNPTSPTSYGYSLSRAARRYCDTPS